MFNVLFFSKIYRLSLNLSNYLFVLEYNQVVIPVLPCFFFIPSIDIISVLAILVSDQTIINILSNLNLYSVPSSILVQISERIKTISFSCILTSQLTETTLHKRWHNCPYETCEHPYKGLS